jgi:integrase/recombinase XerD
MSNRKTPVDDHERAVVDVWRKGHLRSGTIQTYLQWVRRFRAFCENRKLDEVGHLTREGIRRFVGCYAGPRLGRRKSAPSSTGVAHNALHAWSCALRALGVATPPWRVKSEAPPLPPLLGEYRLFRKAHCGVSDWTLRRDIDTAGAFLALLRSRKRPIEQTSLKDVDVFVNKAATRFSTSTVADTCSSLRAFLRCLHATGRLASDLAGGVMRPRFRLSQRPPRTLPWDDVRRILRAVEKTRSPGKRDFAIILVLAAYGLGAAEVLALRLEDIDWTGSAIRARRPKTKARVELPLLPAVATALMDYLRWERPPAKGRIHLFLRKNMPYEPITSGAIRHRIRHWATLAGIPAKVLGAHAFRHSHATRQVDTGANIKVVSDILGHRSVSSTSVYVRVALKRLRGVGLAVPR